MEGFLTNIKCCNTICEEQEEERNRGSARISLINQLLRVAFSHDASCAHEMS